MSDQKVAHIVAPGGGHRQPLERRTTARMKRTETIIETHEVWVVRRPAGPFSAWCPDCEGRPPMLTPEEAAGLSGLSLRAIFRLVEAGGVHFLETACGRLFVCPATLAPQSAPAARLLISEGV